MFVQQYNRKSEHNKTREHIKKNQMKLLEMKNKIIWNKNIIGWNLLQISPAKENISKPQNIEKRLF